MRTESVPSDVTFITEQPPEQRSTLLRRVVAPLTVVALGLGLSANQATADEEDYIEAGTTECFRFPDNTVQAGDIAFVNVTHIQNEPGVGDAGFLNLHPFSTPVTQRLKSSLTNAGNVPGMANVNPNASIVRVELDPAGNETACLSALRNSYAAVDLVGYAPASSGIVAIDPIRLLDTRQSGDITYGQPMRGSETICFDFPDNTVEAGDVAFINLTQINNQPGAGDAGFLNLHPLSTPVSQRKTSSLTNAGNVPGMANVNPNASIVKVEASAAGDLVACVTAANNAHAAADFVGYAPAESGIAAVSPVRLLDTRQSGDITQGRPLPAKQKTCFEFPAGTVEAGDTAFVNVTQINNQPEASEPGFINLHPYSTLATEALKSSLTNAGNVPGMANVNPNASIVKVEANPAGDLVACLTPAKLAHAAVDFVGYAPASSELTAISPTRLLDNREGDGPGPEDPLCPPDWEYWGWHDDNNNERFDPGEEPICVPSDPDYFCEPGQTGPPMWSDLNGNGYPDEGDHFICI